MVIIMKITKLFLIALFFLTTNASENEFLQCGVYTKEFIEKFDTNIDYLEHNLGTAEHFANVIAETIDQILTSDLDDETQLHLKRRLIAATIANTNIHHESVNLLLSIYLIAENKLQKLEINTCEFSENIKFYSDGYEKLLSPGLVKHELRLTVPITNFEHGISVLMQESFSPLGFSHLIDFLKTEALSKKLNLQEKNILLRKIISSAIRNNSLHQNSTFKFLSVFLTAESLDDKHSACLSKNIIQNSKQYDDWIHKKTVTVYDEQEQYEQALTSLYGQNQAH